MSDYGYAHDLSMSNSERNESAHQSEGNQSTIYGDGFNFDGQVKFNGFVDYMATRSTLFNPKEIVPEKSIWDMKPPDFRHQAYAPKPPKRCTILSQVSWLTLTFPFIYFPGDLMPRLRSLHKINAYMNANTFLPDDEDYLLLLIIRGYLSIKSMVYWLEHLTCYGAVSDSNHNISNHNCWILSTSFILILVVGSVTVIAHVAEKST